MWSDWIEHDGKGCPLPLGTLYQAVGEGPVGVFREFEDIVAQGWSWDWSNFHRPMRNKRTGRITRCCRIVRYRLRVYQAGLDLLANIKEPQDA